MSNILSLFPDIYTVSDDGCWLFNDNLPAPDRKKGRPNVRLGQRVVSLARVLCCEKHGPPPDPSMHAAHSCHTKNCINPNHLRWLSPTYNYYETPPKPVKIGKNRNGFVVQRIIRGERFRRYASTEEQAKRYAAELESMR